MATDTPLAFDDISPWGTHRPPLGIGLLLRAAQALPHPLRALNKILRRPIKYGPARTLDLEVMGLKLRLRTRGNATDQSVYTAPGLYDRDEFSVLARYLGEGGVFVDVGANSGIYSLRAHLLMKGRGRIVAVEPDPEMRRQFTFNAHANGMHDIALRPVALSDHEGVADLHVNPLQRGLNTLDQNEARRAGGRRTATQVPLTTLLALLGSLDIDRVDALKIDIEGHEPPVLRHFFTHAPESMWPRVLISEFKDHTAGDILGLLEGCGYRRRVTTDLNFILERAAPR